MKANRHLCEIIDPQGRLAPATDPWGVRLSPYAWLTPEGIVDANRHLQTTGDPRRWVIIGGTMPFHGAPPEANL